MKQLKHLALALLAAGLAAQVGAIVQPIVPKPVSVVEKAYGNYQITPATLISYDETLPGAKETARYAAQTLAPALGYTLTVKPGAQETGIIFKKAETDMPAEGYTLDSTTGAVVITAATRAGAFYGFQTLRQLLPVEIFGKTASKTTRWYIPQVTIADAPRFPWRGMHMDPCRHWFDKQITKDMIDVMAAHKMNTLHWHLTDDQGWRLEIKKYPRLTEVGSIRLNSATMWKRNEPDGIPYGPYFFTQDDAREIVAYAAERNITVVPEIELPGHAMAALSAYPELSCFGKFQNGKPFTPRWAAGVDPDIFCAGNDKTIQFLEDVFDEVLAIFPSKIIHAGGDEAPKVRWKACPKCQQRMKDNNLANEHQLQGWMFNHFDRYLASKGRRIMGWTEVLDGGNLTEKATVMSWLGLGGALKAVEGNRQVVMVPHGVLYIDYGQLPRHLDPYEYLAGMNSIDRVYAYNPTAGIPEDKQHLIIGAQGNNWSENTWGREDLEWKMWPRGSAIAELCWTPQELRNYDSFIAGMNAAHMRRLKAMGLNNAPLPPAAVAKWKPADVSTAWAPKTWDVTRAVTGPGTWIVTFAYTGGANRLDMKDVALLVNGKPASGDAHEGFTGGTNKANVYTLTLTELPAGAKVTLQAAIRADGGSDSSGGIFIEKK